MCSGASPVTAAAGRRIAGFSQPTTAGVCTKPETSSLTGNERRVRAMSESKASRHSGGGALTCSDRSRAATIQPPMSRIDSTKEPMSQMTTSHVMASVACVAGAVGGKDSKGIEPLCGSATGRAVNGPAISVMAGAGLGGGFVMRVTTGATIIAANAAQDRVYLMRALSGRTNSVRAIKIETGD